MRILIILLLILQSTIKIRFVVYLFIVKLDNVYLTLQEIL